MTAPAPKPMPCPFCDAKHGDEFGPMFELYAPGVSTQWKAVCVNCGVQFDKVFTTEQEAIEHWNRRPQQSAEPVAYRYDIDLPPHTSGRTYKATRSNWHLEHGWTETPLFAASPGPSGLVEEMEKLEDEFRATAETIAGTASAAGVLACADRLSALITRHRGKS